ncbi:MAG: 1-acyl-sn-glycerol-3-phosphate acyltransferase [Sphaerochaetaceae bacterium]
MKNKLTIEQKLLRRKLHKPNFFLYWILMLVIWILNLGTRTHFSYKARPGREKGPIILISNHASRAEYQFTAPVVLPKRLNYVVGYNEFFRSPLNIILNMMQAIPKKNFTPDMHAIQQIKSIIKQGGNICLMPEGMSSITGMAQPVIPGGAKMLKKLGVPVYYTKISGAYLTYTKHCLDKRTGRVEVVVDRMFTPEQLSSMSAAEIEDTMNRLLAHDDYIWNKEKQIKFNGKGEMAKNLDNLLYMCPGCGAMHRMETSGNSMKCLECGNTIELDERYNLRPVNEGGICPALVTDWTMLERKKAAEDVKAPDFQYSAQVKVGLLPEYKLLKHSQTSDISGEGILSLDHEGLHFKGTACAEPLSFDLETENVYTFGMCTDITRFYTFVDGRFIEFYPHRNDVMRWFHLAEEMHRLHGGRWRNTEYRHC